MSISSPLFKIATQGLEGYVYELLSHRLAQWVHLSRQQLQVAGWAGEGSLENVTIKADQLRNVPMVTALLTGLRIRSAHAARIRVRIPWHALRTEAMAVMIEDLELICSPEDEIDTPSLPTSGAADTPPPQERTTAAASTGSAAVTNPSQSPGVGSSNSSSSSSSSSYFERISAVLLHNVEIHIHNLRIKLDGLDSDAASHAAGDQPRFEAILSAEGVSVCAADLEWRPAFTWPDDSKVRRRAEVRGMRITFQRHGKEATSSAKPSNSAASSGKDGDGSSAKQAMPSGTASAPVDTTPLLTPDKVGHSHVGKAGAVVRGGRDDQKDRPNARWLHWPFPRRIVRRS